MNTLRQTATDENAPAQAATPAPQPQAMPDAPRGASNPTKGWGQVRGFLDRHMDQLEDKVGELGAEIKKVAHLEPADTNPVSDGAVSGVVETALDVAPKTPVSTVTAASYESLDSISPIPGAVYEMAKTPIQPHRIDKHLVNGLRLAWSIAMPFTTGLVQRAKNGITRIFNRGIRRPINRFRNSVPVAGHAVGGVIDLAQWVWSKVPASHKVSDFVGKVGSTTSKVIDWFSSKWRRPRTN